MRYRVEHRTSYRYGAPVSLCYNVAHLTPRATPTQRVLSATLAVDPSPDDRGDRVDEHGNHVEYFTVERPHGGLVVTSTCELEVQPADASPAARRSWEDTRDAVVDTTPERGFQLESPLVPALTELAEYAAGSFPAGRELLDAVADLTARLHRDIAYEPGATTVATPLAEVLEHRRGVCQDLAHVAVGCLRSVGLAARYVSGYLETVPPPGVPKLIGADATHAWCSVRLADGTWLDLDPTNDLVAPERHLVLAWGRDYGDVVPLKGVVMAADERMELDVAVDVARLPEARPVAADPAVRP